MRFEYIKNSEIKEEQLLKVIKIKNIHWNYSLEEHINWINRNLNSGDFHILMFEGNILVAYLNLVEVKIVVDGEKHVFFGIGNVCSSEKGKGYGGLLLKEIGRFILKNNKIGILLCKDSLIDFYLKNNWKLLEKNKVGANFHLLNTMILDIYNKLKDKSVFIENEF
jgi:hypothetical protein